MVLAKDTEKSVEPMSEPRERHSYKKEHHSLVWTGQAIFNYSVGGYWQCRSLLNINLDM